jgi:UrcA family protein
MRFKSRMILLSIAALTASPLAMADALVNVKTEVVRYDDVRLISTVGAAVLYARVRNAAERVCGGPVDTQQIALQKRYRTCVDEAVSKAVSEVNSPLLSQYYEAKRNSATADSISKPSATAVAKAP